MSPATGRRSRQCGVALIELGIALPFLVMLLLGLADLSRLLMLRQELSDLSREAGNVVSRGGSSSDAITMATSAIATFGNPSESGVVISRVTRRSSGDSTPWIVEQTTSGSLSGDGTIGTPNGPAQLPAITSLAPGVTIMVVELIHGFHPVFGPPGQRFYPSRVRELAVF
jgi:Flp pilus assembly protein TadG